MIDVHVCAPSREMRYSSESAPTLRTLWMRPSESTWMNVGGTLPSGSRHDRHARVSGSSCQPPLAMA